MTRDWIAAPPQPEKPAAQARVHLRYEDVSQDGRLLLEVMPNALGAAIWGAQLARDPFAQACLATGVVPILTRFVIEGAPGTCCSVMPRAVQGRFSVAEIPGERVFLNMWAELTAPIART